jgi:hypothetical protein
LPLKKRGVAFAEPLIVAGFSFFELSGGALAPLADSYFRIISGEEDSVFTQA